MALMRVEETRWAFDRRATRPPIDERSERPADRAPGDGLARSLGWLSLGLGITALAAPGLIGRWIGVASTRRSRAALRFVGARELATGVGLVRSPKADWLWARVAQDVLDLALLGAAARSEDANRTRIGAATVAVMGVTMLDVIGATRSLRGDGSGGSLLGRVGEASARRHRERSGIEVREVVTIKRPVEEVYAFWRDFENLPRFMRHLESVRITGERRSHWKTSGPAGTTVEWDAEVTEDWPNEHIAWRSLPGADVDSSGSIHFSAAPGGRGTEVRADIRYRPPGGKFGAAVAKLFREAPEQQMKDDLRAFKQVMETGEVVRSDATRERGMHPAQPPRIAPGED